jgi:hypothetical protein
MPVWIVAVTDTVPDNISHSNNPYWQRTAGAEKSDLARICIITNFIKNQT